MNLSRHLQAKVPISTFATGVMLLAITLLALFLRLYLLGQDSFWGDEILSVQRARRDWDAFWDFMSDIPAMSLYYALLRGWILLGHDEFTVRILSVIPSVATVPVIYLLGKRLFNAKVGLIAGLLLTVNAFHIQYSQEARSYSLLVLLVTLSSLFLVKSIQRSSWMTWAGYVVTSALSIYAHPFAILVLVAQVSSLSFLPKRELPWKWLVISGVVVGLALLPILLPYFYGFGNAIIGSDEIESTETLFTHGAVANISWNRIHIFATEMTGKGGTPLIIAYLIPVLVIGVSALRKWMLAGASLESWKYALLLSWLFLPIIINLGYSLLVEPALISRYLSICLPALVLLAAAGIYQLYQMYQRDPIRVPVISGVLLIALVVLSSRGASAYYAEYEKEDWRGVANLVHSNWQQGDGILFYLPRTGRMFRFYIRQLEGGKAADNSLIPFEEWRTLTSSNKEGLREAILQRLPADPSRLWLVQGRLFTPERLETRDIILSALACKYQPTKVRRFTEFSRVEVVLLERAKVASATEQGPQVGCSELSIIKALGSNIIEDFENVEDVGVYKGKGASIDGSPVPGVKGQGYQREFSGWWDIVKVTSANPNLYQGISLAIRGSGDVRLQLREKNSPDGRGREHWSVPIKLTNEWRTLSYTWSDFQREATGPGGNGVLDLDLVGSVRLKQGSNLDGFLATDEWMFELVE